MLGDRFILVGFFYWVYARYGVERLVWVFAGVDACFVGFAGEYC